MKTRAIEINKKTMTLTFAGDNAAYDFRVSAAAPKMMSVLTDLDAWMRNEIKYRAQEALQPARDKLWELLNEESLDIHREDGP